LLWPISLDVGSSDTACLIAADAVAGLAIISLLNAVVGFVTRSHVALPPPPGA
jgi:hypothetical protein